nr:MAG TPA: hypothetical protein [Caudoviricetes sp.]
MRCNKISQRKRVNNRLYTKNQNAERRAYFA